MRPSPPVSFSKILPAALAIGLLLRLAWPLADPPPGMSWSIGAYTDPPSNALAARYAVEGGSGRAVNVPERLIYPALNSLARVSYQVLGVSRLSTVILAAFLGTATVAFLALALRRGPGERAAIAGALLATTSAWLVPNSRILTAEGVAVFLVALACFLAMSPQRIGWLAAGAFAAAAGLMGKYHALAFFPALLIFLGARNGWRSAAISFAGALAVAAAWGAAIFLPHRAEIIEWIRQSSVGAAEDSRQGLLPELGWLAPFSALKQSWLAHQMPIVAVAGAWFTVRTLGARDAFRSRIADGSALFVLWAVLSFFATSLISYTAPRYFTLVALPLIACAACQIAFLWNMRPHPTPSRAIGPIAFFAWSWIAAFVLLDALVRLETRLRTHFYLEDWVRDPSSLPAFLKLPEAIYELSRHVAVSAVIAALATSFVIARRLRARSTAAASPTRASRTTPRASPPQASSRNLGLRLLAAALLFDMVMFAMWARDRSYTIELAKTSLREIVSPNAVILGGFAPLLTEGSELVAVPQFGKLEESDLEREPRPTHILLYGADATKIKATSPILEGRSAPVARWPLRTAWTRDLVLFRLLSPDGPAGDPAYEPSLYERTIEHLSLGSNLEAFEFAAKHRRQHGETLTQILLQASCSFAEENWPVADELYRRASRLNPIDPLTFRNLGWIALYQGDEEEARALWMKALSIDPSDPELADLVKPLLEKRNSDSPIAPAR